MTLRSLEVLTLATLVAGAAPLGAQEVTTPDVHLTARQVLDELEQIRWFMGRQQEMRDPIPVRDVDIRENFRQAMTLWQKVNQLGVELVGGGESPPIVQLRRGEAYGPPQVQVVLTSVLARLAEVRDGVGVVSALSTVAEQPMAATEMEVDRGATPTDVFRTIVQANRQANRMLERGVQPGDVFQQVQQSVFYASEILAAMDDPAPLPAVPEYEPGLTPGHVYGRLLTIFDRLAAAFEEADLDMLSWAGGAYAPDPSLTPSDVFDIATLLLSELEYLHGLTPGARAPLQAQHPGHRWPSDVYQQAGILAEQAARIRANVGRNPTFFAIGGSR